MFEILSSVLFLTTVSVAAIVIAILYVAGVSHYIPNDRIGILENRKGGQKGPQRKILREGTYAINLAQFIVLTKGRAYSKNLEKSEVSLIQQMSELIFERHGFDAVVIQAADDCVGIATVRDGPALPEGEIIAPTVGREPADPQTFHNNFQDPKAFLKAGGFRGRQHHVLVACWRCC